MKLAFIAPVLGILTPSKDSLTPVLAYALTANTAANWQITYPASNPFRDNSIIKRYIIFQLKIETNCAIPSII